MPERRLEQPVACTCKNPGILGHNMDCPEYPYRTPSAAQGRGEIHSPGDGNHTPQQSNERSAAYTEEWAVVHVPTGNVVTTYDTKDEAEAAIRWVCQWQGWAEFDNRLEARRVAA